jgi:LytS/YehU family sensor histidine kinase
MVFLGVVAAGVARDYFARYHRRLEETAGLRAQLAEARLTVLQSQLNPHFLFNTLNAISALVDRDARGVRRMIARLSELLRAVDVPASVQAALVPPLILQPLVENSMKHAVSRTSEQSRIDIRAERNGEMLILTVQDTGSRDGDSADTEGFVQPGAGIGLRNTRERLEQIYGDDYSLELDRLQNGGTIVRIRIPYHTSADLRAVPVGGEALI